MQERIANDFVFPTLRARDRFSHDFVANDASLDASIMENDAQVVFAKRRSLIRVLAGQTTRMEKDFFISI